jgi:putative membrane protein
MMKKTLSLLLALSHVGVLRFLRRRIRLQRGGRTTALLDASGAVDALYVVNILTGGGDLTDYGDYTAVENLTGTEAIVQNGDEITVHTDAERFYYQGTPASTALPWNIAVTYTLDGQAVAPAELAGQSGDMVLRIAVSQNKDVNETFFLNYALQIAVLLDTSLCEDIRADNATVAEAAGQRQLSFTLLPGQEATYTVEATVHDFAMDAVTLAGVKMNLDISVDEEAIASRLTELTDAIASLDSGAADLQTGAARCRRVSQ